MKNQRRGQVTAPWHGKCRGQALIIGVVFVAALLTLGIALTNRAIQTRTQERQESLHLQAREIAEAGIEKAIFCLSQTTGANCGGTFGINYVGETGVPFGGGSFTTVLTDDDDVNDAPEITSTGYVPNSTSPEVIVTLRATISRTVIGASFRYGLSADVGGITMKENTTINGNVFSNGSIVGASGARITGDAVVATTGPDIINQAHELNNREFRFGFNDNRTDIAQRFIPSQNGIISDFEFYLRRVGSPNDINIYITPEVNGNPYEGGIIGVGTLSAASAGTSLSWIRPSLTSRPSVVAGRPYWVVLSASPSSSRYWYIGADQTDAYQNGTGKSSPDWDTKQWIEENIDFNFRLHLNGMATTINLLAVGNDARASTFSNGTVGRDLYASSTITSATTGRDAYAYRINASTIGRDAYTTIITGSTVGRQTIAGEGVAEPEPMPTPITDQMINQWRDDALQGGTYNGNYLITANTQQRLGPIYINGNLLISNNATLTITGTIYVTGTIIINNGTTIRLDAGYAATSGVLMSATGINVHQNVTILGSGSQGSYLLMLATGFEEIFDNATVLLDNGSSGLIIAAPRGAVRLENNAQAEQISAFSLYMKNNAIINYGATLINLVFSSGPGGRWHIVPGTWRELP